MREGPAAVLMTTCLCIGAATTPACGQRSPNAAGLIAQVLRGPTARYEGHQRTEVFLASGSATAMVRLAADGKWRSRREFVTGVAAGTVSLQLGQAQWMRGADGRWARLPDMMKEPSLSDTAAAVLRNYEVTVGRPEPLAGRTAVHLRITHRRKSDPSRDVWVDTQTGIVLKDILLAPDGRTRSVSEFTQIAIRAPAAALFQRPVASTPPSLFGPSSFAPRASAVVVEEESGRPILLPRYVPVGYRVILYGIMRTGSGRLMPAVRYSNGLAAFTVFQRGWGAGPGLGQGNGGPGRGRGWRGGRGAGGGAGSCVGQSDIQTSVVAVSGVRSNYLLVGDLSEDELIRVAKSLP